jgi:LacI family transcriptional regulator
LGTGASSCAPGSRWARIEVTRATINDVARLAGVSRATVSLVLRGSSRVAEETEARVQAAIARLNYRPSHLASGLRSRRSHLIGLVVSSLTYPHHARIALGLEQSLEPHGLSVLVANSRQSVERERAHIERLRRYQADGVVITPLQIRPDDARHLLDLRAEGFPMVTAYREIPGLEVDFVGVDTGDSIRQLVDHLAALGHQRIAFLAGGDESPIRAARIAAWHDAMLSCGLEPDPALVVTDALGPYSGEAAIRILLDRHLPFTAVIGSNDFFALGALRALHQAGRLVPHEVSVAGIGGFEPLMSPEKRLTTVVHDFEQVGRLAGELLLRRIAGPRQDQVERHIIPARLLPGETTAPPPARHSRVERH